MALSSSLGPKTKDYFRETSTKMTRVREEIGACSRRIVLAPYALKKQQFDVSDDYVFRPRNLSPYAGFSQVVQNAGFLLQFAFEHPDALADAVALRYNDKNYSEVVNRSIPAFFGYFASKEYLDVAVRFYERLSVMAETSGQIMTTLQPLLSSAATFRFMENALSRVSLMLTVDVNVQPGTASMNILMYGKFLAEGIRGSLPLLPPGILRILQGLGPPKWSRDGLDRLLLVTFLRPAIEKWVKAHECTGLMLDAFDAMRGNTELMDSIWDSIYEARSAYDAPLVYISFEHPFVDFYVGARDVENIADIMAAGNILPETVALKELKTVSAEHALYSYKCRIFPKLWSSSHYITHAPLFGETSERASSVDKSTVHVMYAYEARRWLDMLRDDQALVLTQFFMAKSAQSAATGAVPMLDSYRSIRQRVNLPRMSRCLYLWMLESRWKKLVGSEVQIICIELDKQYTEIMLSMKRKREEASKYSNLLVDAKCSKLIMAANGLLLTLHTASWDGRWRIFIRAMGYIRLVQKMADLPESAYGIILRESNGKAFLSSFVVLHNFAMQSTEFNQMCTDDERALWFKLEATILTLLRSDPQFLMEYVALQEELCEKARIFLDK